MRQKNLKYSLYPFFFRWLTTVVLLCFSLTAFANDRTCAEAKSELKSRLEQSKEQTITILYFLREQPRVAFKDNSEWINTLRYIEHTASKSRGNYYAQICAEIGKRLHGERMYREAYYYLYKAQADVEAHPPKDKRFLSSFHQSLGLSYFYFKRFDESRRQFLIARAIPNQSAPERISILNTLGLINRDQGYTDSSRIYFEKALNLAKETSNKPWTAVLSGNLGHYYWLKKDYALSRKLTQIDYLTSIETGQPGSAMNALSLLIDLDIVEHKTADAQQKLADLEELLAGLDYSTLNERLRYRARTTVQEAVGNHKEALESYRKAVLYMDTISRQTDIENLRKTEFQINFEQNQAELQLLQEKKKRGDILIFVLVGSTIALIFVFIVIIRLIAKRRRREKEISSLKQEQVEKELESTEKEMRTMLSNLIEKNALIEQLTEEIHQFQESPEQPVSDEKLKMIDKLQSFTLLTDDDWLEFKKLFEKLNPTFFSKVLSHSPDLTNAEIRLITLIKLNLSNLEMSRALGISPDSVRKTSLRLRKKLNMELHEELVKFILSL
jgi:DNA-binding CsgD family transcriptional regulator